MNNNKKRSWLKRLFLGLGTIAPGSAIVATAVSCSPLLGSLSRYDSETDGIVVIQTTWSSSNKQIAALHKVVKKYNKEQKNEPGYMRVEVQHVEGGYGTIPSQLLTKIQSQDKKTLPNLYIDYPSAVGMVAPYGMTLNVGGPNGLSRDIFEEMFVSVNDKIAGVESGGIYSVPLAKSTEGITFDKPLLKYIFTELQSIGFKIEGIADSEKDANPTIHNIMNDRIGDKDRKSIENSWGKADRSLLNGKKFNFVNGNRVGGEGDSNNDKVVNEKIFDNYKSLFTFARSIQGLFPDSKGVNVLGIDSSTNLMYNLSQMYEKNDESKFLFTKNDSKNAIDYNFLKKGSSQSSTFQKVYKEFFENLINDDAIWIGGGGAYSSELLKDHHMAISIGSSAGLSKSYDYKTESKLGKSEVGFHHPINKIYSNESAPVGSEHNWNNITSVVAQGPSINTVHISSEEDRAAIMFLKWLYTDKKYDWSNAKNMTPTQTFAEDSSYIVPTKGAFSEASTIAKKIAGKSFEDLISDRNTENLLGLKMSLEAIANQMKLNKLHKEAIVFDVPVGIDTGSMREMIDAKMKASSNSKNSGSEAYGAIRVWNDLRDNSIINGIVEGKIDKKIYKYANQMNRNFSDIDWSWYNYVEAEIVSWIDGDTPKVLVTSVHSRTKALDNIKTGDTYSIRISGIDTPEAHVKLGNVKHFENKDGKTISAELDETFMKKIIDKYKKKGSPLAVISNDHYNELNYTYDALAPGSDSDNNNLRYGYWKNSYIDIQTPNLKLPNEPYDEPETTTSRGEENEDAIYNWRLANFEGKKILSPSVLIEGYWGWRAGDFGRNVIPAGTKVRIATDGKKSYNRIVGSIFFDRDQKRSKERKLANKQQILNSNYSVEITKAGLTLPFIGNPGGILEPNNILWEIGPSIADSFNYALNNTLTSQRDKSIVLYDYAIAKDHTSDPNKDKTLLSYRNQYIIKYDTNGKLISQANYSADSLNEWLKKSLITHGATSYDDMLKGSSSPGSIYTYLKYRNPKKGEKV